MLGLLLIDHGSRRDEANAQLVDMAERVRRLRPRDAVAIAHLELVPPTIADGVAALAKAGASEVIALTYFLADGRHSREDIPHQLGAAAAALSLPWRVAPPLGPDDALARLLLARARLEPS